MEKEKKLSSEQLKKNLELTGPYGMSITPMEKEQLTDKAEIKDMGEQSLKPY